MKRLVSVFLFIALCVAFLPLLAAPTMAGLPSTTVQYLQNQNRSDAWTVMALRASGQSVSADAISLDGLSTATDVERTILGVVAGGANPYQFKNTDLLAKLDTFRSGAQMGDWELLNDDIFGILAYVSAGYGTGDNRITESRQHLLRNQNNDGGWGYRRGAASDSNITAMAVSALLRSGSSAGDGSVQLGLLYLRSLQQANGGFSSASGYSADSASTAWVISAMRSAGIDIYSLASQGVNAYDFLNTLVMSDGSYRWQASSSSGSPIMTSYVAIALSGLTYPVATYSQLAPAPRLPQAPQAPAPAPVAPAPVPAPAPKQAPALITSPAPAQQKPGVHFRIEGSLKQVCQGWVEAWTALDVIKEAAKICPFTFDIQQTSYGPYLARINNDQAAGTLGWLYRVNWKQPSVGADQFNLRLQDYVTWYFGEYDWSNLKVRIINVQPIPTGARISVLAEQDAAGYFAPAPYASIYANDLRYQAGPDGVAEFTVGYSWFKLQGSISYGIRSHMTWYEVR